MILINSVEDMQWLRDVHLPGLDVKYRSAVIEGHESSPHRVTVFERRKPLIIDEGLVFYLSEEDYILKVETQV
ncbi:hypothetical protein LCGC14_0857150 [marine sediment metagenome]|uniref:Uncharacterized protein n=1 Tax=marine sediment metagenome TaxID=412755 RepID=A0A0F9PDA3_9ZZZZ